MHQPKAQFELSLEDNRIYLRALGNNAISVKVDVTPVWNFAKEIFKENPELLANT